jgi:hypothetical protein
MGCRRQAFAASMGLAAKIASCSAFLRSPAAAEPGPDFCCSAAAVLL